MSDTILKELCSSLKLERDRGYQQLVAHLQGLDEEGIYNLQFDLSKILNDIESTWEAKHGALMGAKAVMENGNVSDDFEIEIKRKVMDLLDDNEFRVRIAAGEVLGTLCKKVGPETYGDVKDQILQGIRSNLEREMPSSEEDDGKDDVEKLVQKLSSSPGGEKRINIDAAQIFHDTAGWKSLETWMKCLECIVTSCGHLFNPYVDQELLDLIFEALLHTNRFVRETGFYVCAALVSIGVTDDGKATLKLKEENSVYRHGKEFSEHLGKGLADNWSQVRLAASVATRKFLHSLPSEEARDQFYSILIPRMCLNRYYVAEGVRIYSQETWRQTTEGEGRHLVEKYINNVVDYYIEATNADNHAVREAACACIAELGAKIDRIAVRSHIPRLLEALIVCFNDDSWPVRDAACVACGNFVLCFSEESQSSLPDLYPLFFTNLQDNIASVRQGAALALASVVQAYGQTSLEVITAKIKDGLDGVEKQPASSEKYTGLDKGPATYGVVKRLRDNDMELHTDRQMYSCGSLAPKMGRGGGCMDHKFRKPPEPWELTDGCIHLTAELSNNPDLSTVVAQLLPGVAKAVSFQHYPQHVVLLETLCRQLPHIAKGIGKRNFKTHLESFFDPIFYSMTCDNALTSSAASQCMNQLASFLGPNILRGRVEQYNPGYLDQLNANQFIAPL